MAACERSPHVLDAEFALNEGAGGELDKNDKPVALQIQAGEKVYQDFCARRVRCRRPQLAAHQEQPDRAAHSRLAKLGAYNFAVALNPATRGYFEAESKLASPEVAADMRAVLQDPRDEEAVERCGR